MSKSEWNDVNVLMLKLIDLIRADCVSMEAEGACPEEVHRALYSVIEVWYGETQDIRRNDK